MSFRLGDFIIDRIIMGYAETTDQKTPLYTLTQLSDASIEVTAESKDATDAEGNLIKRFWQGKSGTFTATNAMLNLAILAAKSGNDANIATADNLIDMPKIVTVKASVTTTVDVTDAVADTILVNAFTNDGSLGKAYTLGSTASATEFSVVSNTLTLPVDPANTEKYVIKYTRKVSDGVKIVNGAGAYPKTIRLTLKAVGVAPCEPDVLKPLYIVLPSFQPSPETTINLTTDGQLDFNGDLQVAYCDEDKVLYQIFAAEDDVEE